MNKRVSILVAAYNAEKFIAHTIESVLDQTFSDWELIVCDDGSVDGTNKVIQSYADNDSRITLITQENKGAAIARNKAYEASSGEYIVLLDADDMILPEKLEIQTTILNQNPAIGVVYGDTWFCDEQGKRIELESVRYPGQHRNGDVFEKMCCGNMMAVHSAMVRRTAIDAAGGLHHPTRMQIADWDLWARISEKHFFFYHQDPVADYRLHSMMSLRKDDALKQVRQLEFNILRIQQMTRFHALEKKTKARIYYSHGRICARLKAFSYALKHYSYSLVLDPINPKTYLAFIALLIQK